LKGRKREKFDAILKGSGGGKERVGSFSSYRKKGKNKEKLSGGKTPPPDPKKRGKKTHERL